MNGLVTKWKVSDEISMSDHRIIRLGIKGNFKRIVRNPRDNMAHLQLGGDIRSKIELNAVVVDLNRVVFKASCPAKTISPSSVVTR